MKNRILYIIAGTCLTTSVAVGQVPYQVNGTWIGGETKKVYLTAYSPETVDGERIDSVVVASDGTYCLTGQLETMQPLLLGIEGNNSFRILMGDGKPVTVNIRDVEYSYKHPDAAFTIVGDTLEHNAAMASWTFFCNDFIRKMMMGGLEGQIERAKIDGDEAKVSEAEAQWQTYQDEREKEKETFLKQYGNTLAAPYFIAMNLLKGIPVEETEAFYNRMGSYAKSSAKGLELGESIRKMKALAPGAQAPDFTLPAADGEEFALESLKGHIVILDFWASWCGPCIDEMPNVKEIYARYKESGLKVVGISMDNVKEAWLKAIERLELPWIQVSSLKGMKRCPVAQLYQVYAIPKMYILDKEGRIIAKDLRGDELRQKMDELFAQP